MSRRAAAAIADVTTGTVLASVEIAAPPERVFRAIASEEITRWWGAEGLYRTTAWTGDLRPGGAWRTEGVGADGRPFEVGGEFLEVDPPRRLAMTWRPDWESGPATRILYTLEPTPGGTLVTVRHDGFGDRVESCRGHASGWERVLGWLGGHFAGESRAYLIRLIAPRPTFAFDMDAAERAMMAEHAVYWREQLAAGRAVAFGPVNDPAGAWGLGIVRAASEAEVKAYEAADPAVRSGRGLRYEILPMLSLVTG